MPIAMACPPMNATSSGAGCSNFKELLQREQERGNKPCCARHGWAARQRSA